MQKEIQSATVFLGGEGLDPAMDPRILLIIAGDIESNPGPARGDNRMRVFPVDQCNFCDPTTDLLFVDSQAATPNATGQPHVAG